MSLGRGVGGAVRSLRTVLAELDDVERIVAAPRDSNAARHLASACDRTVPVARSLRFDRLFRLVAVARLVGVRANRVLANGPAEFVTVMPAAFLLRWQVTVWIHRLDVSRLQRMGLRVGRRLLRGLSVIAVSEVVADNMRDRGIRIDGVVANPVGAEVVGTRSPTDGDKLTIGYLGTASSLKGFDLMPEIVRLVGLEVSSARWLIHAGPERALPDEWTALVDDPTVKLRPKTADVAAVYAQLDLIVVPSREESFGRVAVEAMANGVAVVASDLPALSEVVGPAGMLIPVGSAAEAANAIVGLARDSSERTRIGELGRARAKAYEPAALVAQLRTHLDLG